MTQKHSIPKGENLRLFFEEKGIDIDGLMRAAHEKITEHASVVLEKESRETRASYSDALINETLRSLLVNAYNLAKRGMKGVDLTRMILAQANITLKFKDSMRTHGPKRRFRGKSVQAKRETDFVGPRGSDYRDLDDQKDVRKSLIEAAGTTTTNPIHMDTLRKIRRNLTTREWSIFKSRMRGEKNVDIAKRIGLTEGGVIFVYGQAQKKLQAALPELAVHRRRPGVQRKRRIR